MAKKKRSKSKKGQAQQQGWKEQIKERRDIIQFGLSLAGVMLLFFSINNSEFFEQYINVPIVRGYAVAGSFVMELFGMGTSANGTVISNPSFTMNIGKGCDAVTPTILFVGAVLVYPILFKTKFPAIFGGPIALAILNLIRIVSLFVIGVYIPDFFDFAHIELWQGIFIIFTMMLWIYWLFWAINKRRQYETA